jgi:hypothetical protein
MLVDRFWLMTAVTVLAEVLPVVLIQATQSTLPVCPTDTVSYLGGKVTLHGATVHGCILRWYFNLPGTIIYSGRKIHENNRTLGRITVTKSEGIETDSVDLQIDNVQMNDAGLYGCFIPSKPNEGGSAELVVVDPLSLEFARKTVSHTTIEHSCSIRYNGNLNPMVEWIDGTGEVVHFDGLVIDALPSDDGYNVTVFKIVLPASDRLSTWPSTCQVKFTLRNRCTGEVTTEIVPRSYNNNNIATSGGSNPDQLTQSCCDKNQLLHFFAISVSLIALLVSVIVACSSWRQRRHTCMKTSSSNLSRNTTASSMESDSIEADIEADSSHKLNPSYDEILIEHYQPLQKEIEGQSQLTAAVDYSSLKLHLPRDTRES